MCVVSNVADSWTRDFSRRWPTIPDITPIPIDESSPDWNRLLEAATSLRTYVTKQQFEDLKKEVQELKELLKQAQKFDEATKQPNCDSPDKLLLFKQLAKLLGVDVSDMKLNG